MKVNFKFLMMVFTLVLLNMACSGEDGEDGIDGTNGIDGQQGPAGADGMDGADGANGMDGADGADGMDGADGSDGNANVTVLSYDISGVNDSLFFQTVPEITQDVLDNDVILGYVVATGGTLGRATVPLPYIEDTGLLVDFSITVTIRLEIYRLDFVDSDGNDVSITAGDLETLRVVIIESTTSKSSTLNELKSAGVDISDYYAVMDHF